MKLNKHYLLTLLLGPALLAAQGGGLTLDQLLEVGLNNNSGIRIAERNLKVAKSDRRGSFAGVQPSVFTAFGKNLDPGVFVNPETGLSETRADLESSVRINYTIFDGARSWYSIANGKNRVAGSAVSLEQAKQQATFDIKQAYFNYLSRSALLEVANEAFALSSKQLELVEERFKLQAVRETDLLKAKVLTGQRRADVHLATQALTTARTQLNVVIGQDPLSIIILAEGDVTLAPMVDRTTAFRDMADNNTTMKSQVYTAKGAWLNAKMQRGVLLPSINLSYATGQSGKSFGDIMDSGALSDNGRSNLQISFPLFTGMQNTSRYSRSRYAAMAEDERLEFVARDLRRQLENTVSNLESLHEIHPINQEVLHSAEADVRLAEEQYRLGAISILDLLNAQVSLITAKSSLVRTTYDIKISEARLESLTGNTP